ncbi:unnamed protein product [Psylliodes chrysocephalus]|uniref:SET domain-containing protein n=1 Tax=Psylliodes chrysocephalus TaxID=3402493 RepID=A0A9P0D7Z5_9CUCU|nr:unnamed protein product [Psylliodes chrysocephala]
MNPQYVLGGVQKRPGHKYYFKEDYLNEYDAFTKYYRTICSNGYISKISSEVDNMGDYCDLYNNVSEDTKSLQLNLFYEPFTDHQKNENILYATDHVRIQRNIDKGNQLIATRNLSRNTVLINEKPTVLQVAPLCSCVGDSRTSLYRCHHCGTSCKQFYTCDSCNVCTFCSRKCLTIACKEYHVYECFGLQRHFWSMDDTDYGYISFRILLYGATKDFNTDFTNYSYGNVENNYPFIYGLESHFKDMSRTKVNKILYSAVRNLLYLRNKTNFFKPYKTKPNIDDMYMYIGGLLVKHYCQAQINSIILKFPNLIVASGLNISSGSGKAICPTIALINHACSPNATIIIYSNYLVVKSIKSIRKGEEITVCYTEVNAFFSVAERRLITEQLLYFTCRCAFCLFEENSIEAPYKCPFCENGNAKQLENSNTKHLGMCTKCLKTFPLDALMKHIKRAAKYKSAYNKTNSLETLKKLEACYKQIFPLNSLHLLDIYRLIYEKHLGLQDKPIEILKYGILIFHILENGLCTLYIPLLSAKVMFMYKMVDMKRFMDIKHVTQEEFDVAKQFTTEVVKLKKDLLFYLPEERLQYYTYIQTKVHSFFQGITCP